MKVKENVLKGVLAKVFKVEAALIDDINIYPAKTLKEVIEFLKDYKQNKSEIKLTYVGFS